MLDHDLSYAEQRCGRRRWALARRAEPRFDVRARYALRSDDFTVVGMKPSEIMPGCATFAGIGEVLFDSKVISRAPAYPRPVAPACRRGVTTEGSG